MPYFLTQYGVFSGTGVKVAIHLFQFYNYVCTSIELITGNGKVKFTLEQAMKVQQVRRGIGLLFL